MKNPFRFRKKKTPSLHSAIAGRILTGLLIEENNLLLRFTDTSMIVNLPDRTFAFRTIQAHYITFPGWLRVMHVAQDQSQIILEVLGGLYTARISICFTNNNWKIVFQGGRILASA